MGGRKFRLDVHRKNEERKKKSIRPIRRNEERTKLKQSNVSTEVEENDLATSEDV